MRWEIAPKVRCDIVSYSGPNYSGTRRQSSIYAAGGRQGRQLIGDSFSSMAIVAPAGTRVTIIATAAEEGWEESTWRAIVINKKDSFRTKEGKIVIRIPDLDWLDAPDAIRCDPDFQCSVQQVDKLEDGTAWTYGHSGGPELKNNVRAIKVDRITQDK